LTNLETVVNWQRDAAPVEKLPMVCFLSLLAVLHVNMKMTQINLARMQTPTIAPIDLETVVLLNTRLNAKTRTLSRIAVKLAKGLRRKDKTELMTKPTALTPTVNADRWLHNMTATQLDLELLEGSNF
jgi:hypothetical protein